MEPQEAREGKFNLCLHAAAGLLAVLSRTNYIFFIKKPTLRQTAARRVQSCIQQPTIYINGGTVVASAQVDDYGIPLGNLYLLLSLPVSSLAVGLWQHLQLTLNRHCSHWYGAISRQSFNHLASSEIRTHPPYLSSIPESCGNAWQEKPSEIESLPVFRCCNSCQSSSYS